MTTTDGAHEIMSQLWDGIQTMASRGHFDSAGDLAKAIPCESCKTLALQFIDAYELAAAKIVNCPTVPR